MVGINENEIKFSWLRIDENRNISLTRRLCRTAKVIEKLGVVSVEIRNLEDFQQYQSDLSGLILQAEESTTMELTLA